MERKALIVGIDYYDSFNNLHGCVNDAYNVRSSIERNGDGTINFGVKLLTATGPENKISKRELKKNIKELFKDDNEIALFYFSGHGYLENTGGYLATSDITNGDDGFPMNELLDIVNQSKAKNKVIILDCCHSGIMGEVNLLENTSLLTQGLTILTASGADQYATERNGSGIFTSLLVDALNGSAADLLGRITPGGIYAHIDQSLGPWAQRPIFKTNVKNFTKLKNISTSIDLADIRRITEFFEEKGSELQLDPSFEPESDCPNEDNTEIFSILQKYNGVNLIKPVDEEHMYFAAMNNKSCKLTLLGQHYWNLVKKGLI